jgi:hypothetical protein
MLIAVHSSVFDLYTLLHLLFVYRLVLMQTRLNRANKGFRAHKRRILVPFRLICV